MDFSRHLAYSLSSRSLILLSTWFMDVRFDHVVFALLNLKFHLDDDGAMGNPVITDFAECKL